MRIDGDGYAPVVTGHRTPREPSATTFVKLELGLTHNQPSTKMRGERGGRRRATYGPERREITPVISVILT